MTTPYRIERARDATRDLREILRFLIRSHRGFGERFADAKTKAAKRVTQIEDAIDALGELPHRGTLVPHLLPGLRRITQKRAILYFTVDDEARLVRVLAVFFGGQDHQREMLKRLGRLK